MVLHRKKEVFPFDPHTQEPAIRKSICTGEMAAGVIDRATGSFQEWMRVHSLEEYAKKIDVDPDSIRVIY